MLGYSLACIHTHNLSIYLSTWIVICYLGNRRPRETKTCSLQSGLKLSRKHMSYPHQVDGASMPVLGLRRCSLREAKAPIAHGATSNRCHCVCSEIWDYSLKSITIVSWHLCNTSPELCQNSKGLMYPWYAFPVSMCIVLRKNR